MEKLNLSYKEYKGILKRKHTKPILTLLKEKGPTRYVDISRGLRINSYILTYSLEDLRKVFLVKRVDNRYAVTNLGLETLDLLDFI